MIITKDDIVKAFDEWDCGPPEIENIAAFENLIAEKRWGDSVKCPFCGFSKVYKTNRGYRCASKDCYLKFSVKTNTIFEHTKLPYFTMFAIILELMESGNSIPSTHLAELLSTTQKTAYLFKRKARSFCSGYGFNLIELN